MNTRLSFTYNGQTRDYGGTDQDFKDQLLDEYFLVDLEGSYKLSNDYNFYFSLNNLFDKGYENSFKYTGQPRTVNIGLKNKF